MTAIEQSQLSEPTPRPSRFPRGAALTIAAAIGLMTGSGVVLAAAFDVAFFAEATSAYLLGYLLSAGGHGLVASLLGVNPLPSRRWFPHVKTGVLLGALLAVPTVVVDVWVLRVGLGTLTTTLYFVAGVIGVVLVRVPLPAGWRPLRRGLSGNLFAGIDGLIAGALVVVAVVVGASIHRQATLRDTDVAMPRVGWTTGSYLALGDSYSSGEGLQPFAPAPARCHRSLTGSYPALLLGQFDPRPEELIATCSGAVVRDVYRSQVDGRGHPEVGLVTITMGGNDVHFSDVVISCFKSADCRGVRFDKAAGDPGMPAPEPLRTWAPKALRVLGDRLTVLYGRLRADYLNARIVVVGYPHLFPTGDAPLVPNDCASVLRRVSPTERRWLHDRGDDLNNLLYVTSAAAGLEFVSPADAWVGHEPCGRAGQYTNSLKPILNYRSPLDGGSFHPTAEGQRQLAALVAGYLATHPTPPNPYLAGRTGPIRVGADWCPSHHNLAPPPGQRTESCPIG